MQGPYEYRAPRDVPRKPISARLGLEPLPAVHADAEDLTGNFDFD